jgi:hypothetical protein
MPIKLECSFCTRVLRVRDELAGKRVKCPACQQVLTVPALAHPSPEVEDIAAATLSEQPAQPEPAAPAATIDFQCPWCDETVHADAENAGRQMPCPECTKIVKVPLPQKTEPKDWRKVDTRGPAAGLLKGAEQAPEGAWGSKTSSLSVSKGALLEAEAIPVTRQPIPWARYISRGLIGGVLLTFLALGGYTIARYRSEQTQQSFLELALKSIPEGPAASASPRDSADAPIAEIHRAAGEFYIRENQAKQAQDSLSKSRSGLMGMNPASAARDLLLLDLALTQVELGGDKAADLQGTRLDWDKLSNQLRQTLRLLSASEARAEAIRLVGRKLIQHGQPRYVVLLPKQVNADKDLTELTALAALELIRAGELEAAKALAAPLLKPYETPTGKKENPGKRPPLLPNVIALAVALDVKIDTESISVPAPPAALKDPFPELRLGYALGLAAQGKWAQAQEIAATPGNAALRFQALVEVAEAGTGNQESGIKSQGAGNGGDIVRKALQIWQEELQKSPISPWLLLRLVRIASRAGLSNEVGRVVEAIPDPDLQNRARLEITKAQLAAQNGPALETFEKEDKEPRNALSLEAICRHNSRYGSSSELIHDIEQWDPRVRPFGYIGVALGRQDTLH